MTLEDHFAKLMFELRQTTDDRLDKIADELSGFTGLSQAAARLLSGTNPDEIEDLFRHLFSPDTARIATAQAIDLACVIRLSPFARRASGDSQTDRSTPWLNTDPRQGIVLPVTGVDGLEESDIDDSGQGWRGFFSNLLYIPPSVAADHHDREGEPSSQIFLDYARPSLNGYPGVEPDTPIEIGYIPLAEVEEHLEFETIQRGARTCYSVAPASLGSRLVAAVQRLARQGANLIVVPETALPEKDLQEVRDALAELGRDTGCKLIAVLIGIASRRRHNALPRNQVVVLDRNGKEIARQDKLTHWNLTPLQQYRYGLNHVVKNPADKLWEDTDPGRTLTILELPIIGRIAIHICADIQAREPANWVRRNMSLDWSITPLLDSTLTYEPGKWVFARALEAAQVGHTRALVAASMVLTQRQNRVNQRDGEPDRVTPRCGVMMLLDGRFGVVEGTTVSERLVKPAPHQPIAGILPQTTTRPVVHAMRLEPPSPGQTIATLVLEGDHLDTVDEARLAQRTRDGTPAPPPIPCTLLNGDHDTLHLQFEHALAPSFDPLWDIHLIGRPVTAHDGPTSTSFTATRLRL